MNFSWKAFALSFAAMLALDFLWLGFVVNRFYLAQLSNLGRIEGGKFVPVLWSGALVYLLMAFAFTAFVLPRVEPAAPLYSAALNGALLGLCIYGVYDFTNHATLRGWPLPFMAADIFWGGAQFAITAALVQLVRARGFI
ncbi:MAG: DUF2177 family protein [Bdellovibrionota bacterium]